MDLSNMESCSSDAPLGLQKEVIVKFSIICYFCNAKANYQVSAEITVPISVRRCTGLIQYNVFIQKAYIAVFPYGMMTLLAHGFFCV